MTESAQSEGILGIIAVVFIAIIAALVIFPALGKATNQDTFWYGLLMIFFAIGVVIVAIIGFLASS